MFFAPSTSRQRASIWIMGISKASDHIKIKIQMPNPSQEPPASSKAPSQDLKDMDVLCTFKIKRAKMWIRGVPKTINYIKIKIQMPNPSQEPSVSSKAPNKDLEDLDVLCTFKIKIESQNLENGYIKDQRPYTNQDKGAKSQSGAFSVLQSPK